MPKYGMSSWGPGSTQDHGPKPVRAIGRSTALWLFRARRAEVFSSQSLPSGAVPPGGVSEHLWPGRTWTPDTTAPQPQHPQALFSAFEIMRLPRFGPTVGREGVFLRRRVRWNESGCSYRQIPQRVVELVENLSLEGASLVATPFNRSHVTLESVKPTTFASSA